VFCFNQAKRRVAAWSILEAGWSVNSSGCPPSCCSSAPPAGAGRSSASCDHLFWCRQPQRQFTDMFHYCQRFNRCRGKADSEIGKLDPFDSSIYAPSAPPHLTPRLGTRLGHESRARIVARERSRLQTRFLERGHARLKHAAKELKPSLKPPVRLASLEGAAPPVEATPSHIPSNAGALTSLVDFETAPFPYHGTMPDSGRPFLNTGLRAIGATSISAQYSLGVSDFQ
jgi:hypothetical protein